MVSSRQHFFFKYQTYWIKSPILQKLPTPGKIPINERMLHHIKILTYIPPEMRDIYENILIWPTKVADVEDYVSVINLLFFFLEQTFSILKTSKHVFLFSFSFCINIFVSHWNNIFISLSFSLISQSIIHSIGGRKKIHQI